MSRPVAEPAVSPAAAAPPTGQGAAVTLADLQRRCDLMDLPVVSCAHCRRLPDPQPRTLGRPFAAMYPGSCVDCGEPFEPGDRIRRADDGGYVCTPCGDEEVHGG